MTPAQFHMDRVAQCGCAVCRRLGYGWVPGQVHHIAEGSSKRSDFAVVCLCPPHHVGVQGFHGMRAERFCKAYSVPWFDETGLLVWQNEDLALLALGRLPLGVA